MAGKPTAGAKAPTKDAKTPTKTAKVPTKTAKVPTKAPTKTAKEGVRGGKESPGAGAPSELIDARIAELGDWRGETLARVRALIKESVPGVIEEWKWRGVPVWSYGGIICTGETYKSTVKLTFAKGASLEDPKGLFNSSLEGNTRRAIDFQEGDEIDAKALKALVQAAAASNASARAAVRARRGAS